MSARPTYEELIEVKRDGHEHSEDEIAAIVDGFTSGEMPDYQMAAWLMAAYLNGLSADETVYLTAAMVRSGHEVDLSSIPGVKVDKHSTGGVADTTTLVLAPLVAACGVPVAKMSGRGLGHTGGTLDKLESIPGFRVELDSDRFLSQVRDIGVAVIAQSPEVDPADKAMYALRDVTATVPSVPLIVGSIISKKVAGGADAILLDVKVGSGAFMKTEAEARTLAAELTRVGHALGRDVVCVMTDMDQPLGMAVGNALEVREAIHTLRGRGPERLTRLCIELAARMLVLGGVCGDVETGRARALACLGSGEALDRMRLWISAQGGDPRVVDDESLLPLSACERVVRADRGGYIAGFDAEGVGRAAMMTGAGRVTTDASIDHGAGLELAVSVGDRVEPGDELCTLYAAEASLLGPAEERFRSSLSMSDSPVDEHPLFRDI